MIFSLDFDFKMIQNDSRLEGWRINKLISSLVSCKWNHKTYSSKQEEMFSFVSLRLEIVIFNRKWWNLNNNSPKMGEGKTEIDSCLQCPLHCLFMLWKIFIIESTKRKHMSMQCTCLCVLVTVAPFSMVLFGFWEAKGKETQRKSSFRSRLTNKFHCLG